MTANTKIMAGGSFIGVTFVVAITLTGSGVSAAGGAALMLAVGTATSYYFASRRDELIDANERAALDRAIGEFARRRGKAVRRELPDPPPRPIPRVGAVVLAALAAACLLVGSPAIAARGHWMVVVTYCVLVALGQYIGDSCAVMRGRGAEGR
ncbi:MAG TPA: hypothetical protein VGK19_08710 [Capsulimonadaceae bacterium]|jgi:uncharacterized membrane protein